MRYRNHNGNLFGYLEEATRSTSYAASIKPYERTRNGRGAWQALNTQHTGEDKCKAMLKLAVTYVTTTKWDGNTSISLERHVNNPRKAYIDMESAAKHITFQLPDGRTRVQNLLDSTEECKDPKFLAQ